MKKMMAKYVVFSYLGFYVFLAVIAFTMYVLKLELLAQVLIKVSAWTSTFVFALLFKKIYPGDSFFRFVAGQFRERIKPAILLTAFGIPALTFAGCILFFGIFDNQPLSGLMVLSPAALATVFFMTIIAGPLGEELGWRAFFLTELRKKNRPLKSALITGFFWGFWHAPLWFLLSGLSGLNLLVYCVCFMVYIISFTVIMTLLYGENRNLIITIIMHLLVNYSMNIQKTQPLRIMIVNTAITVIIALICAAVFKFIIKRKI